MGRSVPSPTSRLAAIPPLTAGTIALAVLALPLFAALDRAGVVAIGPVAEIAIGWSLAVAIVGIAVVVEGLSIADVGVRPPAWIDVGYTLVAAAAALLVFAGTDPLITAMELPVEEGAGTMAAGVGLGVALAGAVTTGVVEEILFRGYPIERLLEYTDSAVVAGGVAWGLFTAAHAVAWPLGNLVQISAVAAVLTVVYLRRRTLAPVAGAHVLVWVLSVLGQFYG